MKQRLPYPKFPTAVVAIVLLLFMCAGTVVGQTQKYIVYFTDKGNSPFATAQPSSYLSGKALLRRSRQNIAIKQTDWPVNPNYVAQVQGTGAIVIYTSRWLNAAVVEATSTQLAAIQGLACIGRNTDRQLTLVRRPAGPIAPYIDQVQVSNLASLPSQGAILPIQPQSPNQQVTAATMRRAQSLNYGQSGAQMNLIEADSMHDAGFDGTGITIAVMDAGFLNVDQHQAFEHIRNANRILGTYDFVTNSVGNVYRQNQHGGAVLSIMAGFLDGKLIGPAYGASFYLFRTEDAGSEYEIECANWVVAAERADSLGVDILSTSLGYSTFDNPIANYTPFDLDGKTAFMSRAATMAAATGMLVVNSAGNYGTNTSWDRKITMPADADSILAVGATNISGIRAGFSSMGNTTDGRIKPDISGPGAGIVVYNPVIPDAIGSSSGTSFSAPIIAGLAAGIWQAYPTLTAMELRQLLLNASTQASAPDSLLGWGIPKFSRIRRLITSEPDALAPPAARWAPNPVAVGTRPLLMGLNTTAMIRVQVLDMAGRELYNSAPGSGNATYTLQWTPTQAGVYHVNLWQNEKRQSLKLVAQ